jgi:uncharacterized protein involved in outer membrane biogenesis
MPSEEEVQKVAEAHAKAWADAERRAAENAGRASQPHYEAPRPAGGAPAARARRKPIPWGKIGAGLFILALIAVFAVPFVLPMEDYATRLEQHLSAELKQPVHIGRLAGRLLPTPRLEMSDVSIGEAKQIQARQARVEFALSAIFSSDARPIATVALEGVQVDGAALTQVSAWLQQVAADTVYPVAHVTLDQGKLEAEGIQLSGVGGDLSFDQDGKFSQMKLHAEDKKYEMEASSAPKNKLQVSITVRGSALPLLPDWVFDELNAKGELTKDGLLITDLDSRISGGLLLGDARIDWRSGWSAQGTLVAKTITLQNMNKVMSGDMDATAHFLMRSPSLEKLTASATLDGAFTISQGNINGIDFVETARLRSRTHLPGGRTHFGELSGDLSVANGEYRFRKLKMDAGVLKATGTVDIVNREVSGQISADLTMRAGMGPVALQVGGTTDSLSLRAVR